MRFLIIQLAYENLIFWRNAISGFFTVALPVLLMVLFSLLFGGGSFSVKGGEVSVAMFFVPALTAMAVIGACYTNIAMAVSITRDRGLLKRFRATPLPVWALMGGKILHAILLGYVLAFVLVVMGMLLFDAAMVWDRVGAFLFTLFLGSATFCALGLAVTTVIPNAEASPAIVQASVLPLLFISDVFIPMHNAPEWLQTFASVFPVRHFALSLQASFNPFIEGSGFQWFHLGVLALWFVFGLFVSIRFFRWEAKR